MRKLAIFAGSFSLGIFIAQYLLEYTWMLSAAFLALFFACGSLFLSPLWRRRGVLVFTALALAFGYNWLYTYKVQRPMEELSGSEQRIHMTLCDYASETDFGAKVTVKADGLPAKVVYYGDSALLDMEPGQSFSDTVFFQNAARIRDDDVTAFTSKGVFLLAYSREAARVDFNTNTSSVRWLPVKLKHRMQCTIQQLFDKGAAGFLNAMLTGDKSLLSVQSENDLSEAGLYHILAVSGMHCSFLLAVVSLLLGKHRRRLVAVCGIPILVVYALLTGASPSVVRACIMLSMLLAAPLFHRENDGPTALTAALFLILLHNPFAAASVSLQLSFAAMAGILWLTPKLYAYLTGKWGKGRVRAFFAASFSASLGAMVFSVPVSAYYFGTLVLVSPISNLLCLWAASTAFVLGMLSVLVGMVFLPLGMAAAIIPKHLAGYILDVAHMLALLPHHALYFTNPYLKYWLAFAYAVFAVAYFGKGRQKYTIALGTSLITLILVVYLGASRYNGGLEAIVLDVGQGQSVVLCSEDAYALIDCGSANSWYDAGNTASDYLETMGCRELDLLVVTHYDQDHFNGLESLLSRMSVNCILLPEWAEDEALLRSIVNVAAQYNTTIEWVTETREIPFGEAELTIFPPIGEKTDDNEQSLSVLATLHANDILITGDMNGSTEKQMMKQYQIPELEMMVAGHHGSKYATSSALLNTLTPDTVCISVGTNSYGHPSEELLQRLAKQDCNVYRTDLHGNIRFSWN